MSAEDFSHLACPNPDCPAYGRRGAGNLRPHGWSTQDKRVRCLRCATCGRHFSGRANTPLFGLRTDEGTLVAIARHLAEGVGCRATARLTGVTLNTVLRFTARFGKHAELFHDSAVRGIQPKQIWTMEELLCHPLYPPIDPKPKPPPRTYKEVLERLKGVFGAAQDAPG